MFYYFGEKPSRRNVHNSASEASRRRRAINRCVEIRVEDHLGILRSELNAAPHPRHVELATKPVTYRPKLCVTTHFLMGKRTDLLNLDWMRRILSLAGSVCRMRARQWEQTASQICRLGQHFLRSRSLASDLPDVAAMVISPARYLWHVRNHPLRPIQRILTPLQQSKGHSIRLNDRTIIRRDEVRFVSPDETRCHRLDLRTLARRLLGAEFEQEIHERVVQAADSGTSDAVALTNDTYSQTGFRDTPLISFVRFHTDDLSNEVMRFSVCPSGGGLIYVRRASGPNLYLALTEPYDFLAALSGLSNPNTYALL